MKARSLEGKVIRKVHQSPFPSTAGPVWCIDAIEFTDGSVLRFLTVEGEGEYGVEGVYPARDIEGTR